MDFYYPNRTNDFWFMMGLIFAGDRFALYDKETKLFNLDAIKSLLTEKGIALNDTGLVIRRLKETPPTNFSRSWSRFTLASFWIRCLYAGLLPQPAKKLPE